MDLMAYLFGSFTSTVVHEGILEHICYQIPLNGFSLLAGLLYNNFLA